MRHTTRMIGAVLVLALLVGHLHAQKVGTSSLQFLKVMPTARATAMGDAYVSLAAGADAQYWNAAGLTSLQAHEMASTITMWLFDTKQLAFAYGLPLGEIGTIGVQFQYVDYGTMEETRADNVDLVIPESGEPFFNAGLTGRSFTPYAYLLGVSYARAFTDRFSAAVTVKYVKESLWSNEVITKVNSVTGAVTSYKTYADVVLFDFGMIYDTGFRSVRVGVSTQNFGPQVTFADVPHPAPLAFRLGVSANIMGQNSLLVEDDANRVTLAYDLFQPNDYRQQMHVGAEYAFAEFVALRAGYKVDYDSDGMTFGGGIHTDLSGWPVNVDYSYGKMGEFLNSVHRVSLGVQFR